MKKQINSISKPQPFVASGSEDITAEELARRQRKYERLDKIGENHAVVTGKDISEGEIENPYRVKAMVLINQDQDVPEELLKQIEEYDKEILKIK